MFLALVAVLQARAKTRRRVPAAPGGVVAAAPQGCPGGADGPPEARPAASAGRPCARAGRAGEAGGAGGGGRSTSAGVHAAISVPGMADELPPEYVPRDVDSAEFGVRARVAAAAQRGGFVLLTGGSSVGKTRCAAEAVRALLPDWWLVHPAGPGEVTELAAAPWPRTVLWLDELQRYLHG